MHEPILRTIQDCEAMCEYMVTFFTKNVEVEARRMQIALLRDCADICSLTEKYIARHSIFSKYCTNLCGYVCNICGQECKKFEDYESQKCAEMCLKCAKECREYFMMG